LHVDLVSDFQKERSMKNVFIILAVTLLSVTCSQADETPPQLPTPEQIRSYYRENAPQWPTIPRPVLLAFVAAEDRYFFDKPPQNSTITRQIGNWHLLPRAGRMQKIALSFVISKALSHDEVLNWYTNKIFLGQTCFGVSGAATAYFGKSVEELSLEEAAYLAALPKAPMHFHPVRSYDRAIERRNFVLAEMEEAGFISESEATEAAQTDLNVSDPLERCEQP
jgi:penicillin-binding protein 1A